MITKFEKLIKLSFLSLATIPLLKENYNSLLIIICFLLTFIYSIKNRIRLKLEFLIYSIPFILFFIFELFNKEIQLDIIFRQLPFVFFPIIFLIKPTFINSQIKNKSLKVFQVSVFLQCIIYLITFLKSNSVFDLFNISSENIPFFRSFVMQNYLFEIHPTYFSSFLLFSLTISFFYLNKNKLLNIINIIISIFFLFIFSSRIIIIILMLTVLCYIIYSFKTYVITSKIKSISLVGFLLLLFLLFNNNTVKQRFLEIKTEINKPVIGNYYNSTNIRVAIIKCNLQLLNNLPFFGYKNELQNQLNLCYENNNDSNFYKINVYNSHNYFIHLILYGGFLFFLFFIYYFYKIFKSISYSYLALFIFFQILIINLTENYLSRHFGIVLFSYFTSLFIFIRENKNAETKNI